MKKTFLIFTVLMFITLSKSHSNNKQRTFAGGDRVIQTQALPINWDVSDENENIDIYYFNGDKGTWHKIVKNFPSSYGTYTWRIPGKVSGDKFRIKIMSSSSHKIYYISTSFFTILQGDSHKEGDTEETQAIDDLSFQIYPNPANDKVSIKFDGNNTDTKIRITDLNGDEKMNMNIPQKSNSYEFSTSLLNSGAYIISMESGGKVSTKSFILAR